MKSYSRILLCFLASSVFALSAVCPTHGAAAADSATVKRLFANPPREYASGPLWVWNDLLTEKQIRDTMRDLAGQRVRQVFVHPRPGLMTPYLSDDWFKLWKVALDEAANLDMNVWIYDENSYPSGFAGGWVPELMPESRGMGLELRQTDQPPASSENPVAVLRLDGDKAENMTAKLRAGEVLPAGQSYLVASLKRAGNSPWHAGRCYVNLLTPGVTEKFLEVTMGAYQREIGSQFGKRVPGVFSDEPNIHPAGGLPWCDDLPQQFKKHWGYSLVDNLASLKLPVGDWRKVRHNYFSTLNDLFIERWSKPYHDYCEQHHLQWTGHYWDHEWPNCGGVPDNMAMYAWHQRPAIDCLMNQYAENTHAQFGNVRMVKELSSVANQLGRERTLCEIYGAGGWDLRFEDMKRIGDWLEVLGVNTLDEHLSYVTLRGARKNDHPQSFSYHEPWWRAYHVMEDYFTRLTAALSHGEQINHILVLEPTTTAWMYQGDGAKLKELGDAFFKLVMSLEAAQIEYDLGDEDIIARHGEVKNNQLWVGNRGYDVVVLPPGTENINSRVANLGEEFLTSGGRIVCLGAAPARVDGSESARPAEGAQQPGWMSAKPEDAPSVLRRWNREEEFRIRRVAEDSGKASGILFHMRRQLANGQLLFLVNTSITSPSGATITSSFRSAERWDLRTGKVMAAYFEPSGTGINSHFSLSPCDSLLLFLSNKPLKPDPITVGTGTDFTATGPMQIRRTAPNVLKLDYVDITAGGETKSSVYYYAAAQFAFQKNGMPANPWDSAVQFKDELISKKFPADSGFTASYRFTIEGPVPQNLALVLERPDLYKITVNGQPVAAPVAADVSPRTQSSSTSKTPPSHDGGYTVEFKDWWLDKAFGRIAIAKAAKPGENMVTLTAKPFTIWDELEAAFVLGDFALKPTANGFVIIPDQPLKPGKWNEQGHPFYASGVSYRQQFTVNKRAGHYTVALSAWYGSVAEVKVNGKSAGYVASAPWECDVTKQIKRGANDVEVIVIGTLKNTLGPHHGKPGLGSAWPGMFRNGPASGPPDGTQYSTVGYGLFEPFVLKQALAAKP
jgi:hypothetical protein